MVMAIKVNIPGFLLVLVVVGGRGGGLGYPSTNQKIGLPPPFPLHCFATKMLILKFSCSFWAFCPKCPPLVKPNWKPCILLVRSVFFFIQTGEKISPRFEIIPPLQAWQVYHLGAENGVFLSAMQRSLYNAETKLRARPWWTVEESGYKTEIK